VRFHLQRKVSLPPEELAKTIAEPQFGDEDHVPTGAARLLAEDPIFRRAGRGCRHAG
jgi:hypothetical protein